MTGLGRIRGKRRKAPCSAMHSQWPLEKHIWMHPTWTMYLQEICSDSLWPQPLVWKTSVFRGLECMEHAPPCGESLSLAAAFVAAGYARHAVAVTSSHFGSAEKQFRFPNQYANQRPVSATWTVTGSAAFIVGSGAGGNEMARCDNEWTGCDNADSISRKVQIEGITTGVVVDYGIKDAMNMGAAMAPAACELIVNHLSDFGRKASYYDRIVTGDLGSVGQKILIDLCRQKGVDISKNHEDCGMKMFDATNQNTGSGGSGCACSATVLSAYYLPKLRSGELKRILFVPTGALLSPVSFNEGESVPGIAHGVVLEAVI